MLLRHVAQHIKMQNWTAVGLDFAIVVIGVYIGIQFSNWNNARQVQTQEREMLTELRVALNADFRALKDALPRIQRIIDSAEQLQNHMRNGGPYNQKLDEHFGIIYGFYPIEFNRASYESLKSQGLGLISDHHLRSEIVRTYEQTYRQLQSSKDAELRIIIDLMEPYFLKHFEHLRFNQSATPIHYDVLVEDTQFLNLIDYRLQVARQNQLPTYEMGIEKINQLLAVIENKL